MATEEYFGTNYAVTDELVEHARSMIGMPVRTEGWNAEASRDSIRHYVMGLGDDNPLFTDPEYGRRTVWGTMLAPPTFLFTISDTGIVPGLAGLQPVHTGGEFVFERPIRMGETLSATARLADVRDLPPDPDRGRSRKILQVGETTYYDAAGQVVATHTDYNTRTPRSTEAPAYEPREETVWSVEQREEIGRQILAHERRGAEARYGESVEVGDELPQVIKEINTLTMLAYYAGCPGSPGYKACELQWKYRDRARHHPEALPNQYDVSYFEGYTLPSLGHTEADVAHAIGMPGRYNNGLQRIGWASHLVTDWMGDAGEMKLLSMRHFLPEIYGDVIYVRGRVASKDLVDGQHHITCDIESVNQFDEVTSTGSATVVLPSKADR